jgi:hypothetical protein
VTREVRLTCDDGQFYLCFLYKAKKMVKTAKKLAVAALDPGVRTFQTSFDNNGNYCKFGHSAIEKIFISGKKMDRLHSEISKLQKTKYEDSKDRIHHKNLRRRLKKKIEQHQHKVQNRIRDVHWKVANRLCSKYDDILIPK